MVCRLHLTVGMTCLWDWKLTRKPPNRFRAHVPTIRRVFIVKRSERSNQSLDTLNSNPLQQRRQQATEAKSQTALVHCVYIKRRRGISHWITVCELQCEQGWWEHRFARLVITSVATSPRLWARRHTKRSLPSLPRYCYARGWAVAYNGDISPGHVRWICTSRSFRGRGEPVDFLWCKYEGNIQSALHGILMYANHTTWRFDSYCFK